MTARRADLADLPAWPRWMSREQAASYVGVSPNVFDAEVRAGVWPKAEKRGSHKSKRPRLTWDRKLLDLSSDLRSGIIANPGDDIGDVDWSRSA
jgi:hypothetical protein